MAKEKFKLHDEFVASLYDRRYHSAELPKTFKDVYRCGHIIERLYTLAANDNSKARNALIELSDLINKNHSMLIDVVKEVDSLVSKKNDTLNIKPDYQEYEIPYQWSQKMYVALVEMLLTLDRASISMAHLKANEAIQEKRYRILQKRLAHPIRSVLEECFRIEKKHEV